MNAMKHESRAFATQVSHYDRFSAGLVAGITIAAFFAGLLLLLVAGRRIYSDSRMPTVISLGEAPAAASGSAALDEPRENELTDVAQPDASVAMAAIAASIEQTKGIGNSFTEDGEEEDDDDELEIGDVMPPPTIPAWERWEIKFTTTSVKEYARQLDFFEIELAAINRKKPTLDYASHLSTAKPTRRVGRRQDEPRLYFVHSGTSALKEMTRRLLTDAGIDSSDRFLAQFFPKAAQESLLAVEKASLGDRPLAKVTKTVFGIRPAKMAYEFYVIHHDF